MSNPLGEITCSPELEPWERRANTNIELAQLRREVERLREVKAIRDEITDVLEAAGYFHMSNGEGVASILRELAELRAAKAV